MHKGNTDTNKPDEVAEHESPHIENKVHQDSDDDVIFMEKPATPKAQLAVGALVALRRMRKQPQFNGKFGHIKKIDLPNGRVRVSLTTKVNGEQHVEVLPNKVRIVTSKLPQQSEVILICEYEYI